MSSHFTIRSHTFFALYLQDYALPPGVFGHNYEGLANELTGIQCVGNETSVLDCPINNTAVGSCYPYTTNYASVSCFNEERSEG